MRHAPRARNTAAMGLSCVIGAAILTASCGPAAPPPAPRTVSVWGEATLRKEPEVFTLAGAVRVRETNRDRALETAGDTLNALRDNLSDLRGLERLDFSTDTLTIEAVLPFGCTPGFMGDQQPSDCSPVAHVAFIPFNVLGAPYQVAGDAAALLAERGADSVRVSMFNVADPEGFRAEARRQAVLDALETAQELAGGAGERLGPVVSMNYGRSVDAGLVEFSAPAELPVDGLRTSPRNPIRLTPDDIRVTERVNLVVELLGPDAAG